MVETPPTLPIATPEQSTASEMDVAFSGSAPLTNRFYISLVNTGLRIAFAEQYAPEKIVFRNAVSMSFPDGIALYQSLQKLLVDVEKSLGEAYAASLAPKDNG